MTRHKTRRGGGFFDTIKSALGFKTKEEKCAAKKADYDKECGPGEASATEVPGDTPVTEPTPTLGGRSRRRRQTRRRYKSGKHRRSH